jgi:hypothetical protein
MQEKKALHPYSIQSCRVISGKEKPCSLVDNANFFLTKHDISLTRK